MTKFMLLLAAAAVCGPLAANAAVMPIANAASAVVASPVNSAAATYQLAQLNGQVAALTGEVQALQTQSMPGTNYTPELAGVIPSGG
jgi:TolA-binding protein